MARTLHPSSAASMSANGPLKPSKLKKKNGQRDPQEYRAAGFLTINWHIPSTYLGWILYGRVRRAEPRVKLMHSPLCQNTAGCFIREHHHRALDAALTSAHPDSVCSKPIHPPLLKKSPQKARGKGDVVMKGVGDVSWVLFVFVCFYFFILYCGPEIK